MAKTAKDVGAALARQRRRSNAKVAMAKSGMLTALAQVEVVNESMQRVRGEKARLQDKLNSAQKLVVQVMAEGGALLNSYHLEYSNIDFGGADVQKRHKLGEGAQV